MLRRAALVLVVGLSGAAITAGAQATTQVPKPFPKAGSTQVPPPTPTPSPSPMPSPSPATPASTLPIYPAAQFLETIDAGKGQQFQLYGTDALFADIVAYYKNTLKSSGRVLFQAPPMYQFDLGRFDEGTMVFPPSVVIKDYTWNGSEGYLHVSGTASKRYKTIIQIVSAPVR